MNEKNSFILSTALDYDLPYEVVEDIYNSSTKNDFYSNLENRLLDICNL